MHKHIRNQFATSEVELFPSATMKILFHHSLAVTVVLMKYFRFCGAVLWPNNISNLESRYDDVHVSQFVSKGEYHSEFWML
jgi:hypothetical protein